MAHSGLSRAQKKAQRWGRRVTHSLITSYDSHARLSATGAAMLALATLVCGAVLPETQAEDDGMSLQEPRVIVLKSKRVLHLFDDERLIRTFPIGLGRQPVGQKQCEGDGRTPEGSFRIATRNRQSKYHRFLGLDYPDASAAERGLLDGLITGGEAEGIHNALAAERCPSWTTALGGAIGIHGHGSKSDWTAGCIALEDGDAELLFNLLRIGDVVEVLP
ncbi:MAG: L,D-transpeptidase [bacterium]|nr:L,D-transpeptidase [bacterium]